MKMMPLAEPSAMVEARPPVEENGQDLPLTRETLAENLLRQQVRDLCLRLGRGFRYLF